MEKEYKSISEKIYLTFHVENPGLPKMIENAFVICILIGMVGFGLFFIVPTPDIIEGPWVIIPLFLTFCLILGLILLAVRLIISVFTWVYVNAPSPGLDEGQGPADEPNDPPKPL